MKTGGIGVLVATLITLLYNTIHMVHVENILSLTKGVGGSHTRWQRDPPPHITYQVSLTNGTTALVQAYAENRALDDADHPTIQALDETTHMQQSGHTLWTDLTDAEQTAVRSALAEEVKTEPWFMDD